MPCLRGGVPIGTGTCQGRCPGSTQRCFALPSSSAAEYPLALGTSEHSHKDASCRGHKVGLSTTSKRDVPPGAALTHLGFWLKLHLHLLPARGQEHHERGQSRKGPWPFPAASPHENSPEGQQLPPPLLTEYEQDANSEQDHGKNQAPNPQALVICREETQGLLLLGSGKGAAPVASCPNMSLPHRS